MQTLPDWMTTTTTCELDEVSSIFPNARSLAAQAERRLDAGEGFISTFGLTPPHTVVTGGLRDPFGVLACTDRRLMYLSTGRFRSWRWEDIAEVTLRRKDRNGMLVVQFRERSGERWKWHIPEIPARMLVGLHLIFTVEPSQPSDSGAP